MSGQTDRTTFIIQEAHTHRETTRTELGLDVPPVDIAIEELQPGEEDGDEDGREAGLVHQQALDCD